MPSYPNSVFFWQPRIDQQNIVYANDPNTIASEIQAIESTIGTNPNWEFSPPTGSAVQYPTMSARVSAAMNNTELPYAVLTNLPGFFIGAGSQIYNSYSRLADPYNIWNGTVGTVPCTGWWSIFGQQKWNQHGDNFHGGNIQFIYVNGSWVEADLWNWNEFFGDTAFTYANIVTDANGFTSPRWEGILNKGDKIQILSVNSTFCPGIQVNFSRLFMMCHRTISGGPFPTE